MLEGRGGAETGRRQHGGRRSGRLRRVCKSQIRIHGEAGREAGKGGGLGAGLPGALKEYGDSGGVSRGRGSGWGRGNRENGTGRAP